MVLDVIIVTIIVLCMVFGFRRGFVYTFVHTLGWLGAMIAAFVLAPYARTFLKENTGVYTSMRTSLMGRFHGSADSNLSSLDSLPKIISGGVETAANEAANALATQLADLFIVILGFAVTFLVIKLLFFTITRFLSKKKSRGFIGFFDGLLGLIAGALKGIILVFLFLALLLPAVNLMSPDNAGIILASMDASRLARPLYDSNFIVLIISDFFG